MCVAQPAPATDPLTDANDVIFLSRKQGDDPPFLSVGTEVSAKYKGAFCEAKVRKVVKSIKCKVSHVL